MSDLFYRAIRSQEYLDEFYPERNWPLQCSRQPRPHVIETVKLLRKGYGPLEISNLLGISYSSVKSTARRCNLHEEYN